MLSAKRYIYNSQFLYCIRIFIALSGTVLLPWWMNQPLLTMPLTLGVVAAASTDLDDRLTGRLVNLIITLVSFFIASVSVELLFPYPWLFLPGLLLSTFAFIMLGVLGQRYATIAFGALLIAADTMLGHDIYNSWYQQPILLLAGALWYNFVTLTGHLLFPIRPVQDNLARCFRQLGDYLDQKAMLFDPDEDNAFKAQIINLIMSNKTLVSTLHETKISLFSRLKSDRGQQGTRRMLSYYFIVQDIHERASSSHAQYQALSAKFRHSDTLFRFQRLLSQQGIACRQVAAAILNRQQYTHSPLFERLFMHLEESINQLTVQSKADLLLVNSLQNLFNNLRAIDNQLANINSEQSLSIDSEDNALSPHGVSGLRDIITRFKQNLTPKSALFRHAVRMGLVFCLGYIIIQLSDLSHGYWIILTSLFVCQPNYNATKHRLTLRIVGTIAGILIALPILYIVPTYEGKMVLVVLSGLLFFAFRSVQYAYATLFMTLLVLFCSNLLRDDFSIAIPRIIATFIGCGIAWAAVTYLWPDWQFRGLPAIVKKTCNANSLYLAAIDQQYHYGKSNHLDYRIARLEAHTNDAELAAVVSNISAEPKIDKELVDLGFRFLSLNHTLLSYISTLGSHRQQISVDAILRAVDQATQYITDTLHFEKYTNQSNEEIKQQIQQAVEEFSATEDKHSLLIFQQIQLILDLLPEFVQIAQQLSHQD